MVLILFKQFISIIIFLPISVILNVLENICSPISIYSGGLYKINILLTPNFTKLFRSDLSSFSFRIKIFSRPIFLNFYSIKVYA